LNLTGTLDRCMTQLALEIHDGEPANASRLALYIQQLISSALFAVNRRVGLAPIFGTKSLQKLSPEWSELE
jgi:hypothetical protein